MSEEMECRVTEKLSYELSKKESGFLGPLSKLDEFLMNTKARVHYGPVKETSGNSNRENQDTN